MPVFDVKDMGIAYTNTAYSGWFLGYLQRNRGYLSITCD